MVHIRWACSAAICGQMKQRLQQQWFMFKLTFWSLVHNSLSTCSCITILDIGVQPLFWVIDHIIRYTGPAFILLVAMLVSSVIIIIYMFVLPFKLQQSVAFTGIHFVAGHWLLVNIVFHYIKATFTNPGTPAGEVSQVVSICKVCIAPKPPRTHHCSICRKCVLKMDHHCPWLNNCVGFYNHRHFFLFSVYMCIAAIYVSVITYPLFAIISSSKKGPAEHGMLYPIYLLKQSLQSTQNLDTANPDASVTLIPLPSSQSYYRKEAIMFVFILSSAVSMALLLLVSWHGRLIHRGETSIEVYINSKEKIRLRKKGLVYRNPYSLGAKRNWKIFLGLTHGRTFWRHVLLPSAHKPDGDGQTWDTSLAEAERGLLLL